MSFRLPLEFIRLLLTSGAVDRVHQLAATLNASLVLLVAELVLTLPRDGQV